MYRCRQSNSRPSIPTRPEEDNKLDEEDAEGEAPQIVVLNEGKHLTEAEAVEAKKSELRCRMRRYKLRYLHADTPTTTSKNTAPAKKGASLRFSSADGKRKVRTTDEDEEGGDTFEDVSKRAKIDADTVRRAQANPVVDAAPTDAPAEKKTLTKEEKAAKKLKRKKDKSMLSFQD